jgi:tetratricopeptide (TPR) repeat protein
VKKTLAEHLKSASGLFDAGEVVKAGQMWQAILKREPTSAEALAGMARVREALSGGGAQAPPWSLAGALGLPRQEPQGAAPQGSKETASEFDAHLREGCTLYDKGDPRGALAAWERALRLDAGSALALSYIRGVRKELGLPALEASPPPVKPQRGQGDQTTQAAPAQSPPAPPHAEEVERLLEAGVKSFEKGRFERARQDWERAQALDPGNGLAKGYLGLLKNETASRAPSPPSPPPPSSLPPPSGSAGRESSASSEITLRVSRNRVESGQPAKTGPAQAPMDAVREPTLDRRLEPAQNSASPLWRLLGSRLVVGAAVMAMLLAAAALVLRNIRKDALLAAARADIREGAIRHAEQSAKTERLMPTVGELCQDARSLMRSDPLAAYLLADEALKRDRMDAAAPKLMEEAKQAMLRHSAPPPSGNYAMLMAAGDLEGAAGLLEAQLRQNLNDRRTRENLARVSLLMARACAADGNWEGARTRLLLGSALFPSDLEWQARLRLLDYLRTAREDERALWIGLLG